MLRNNQTENAVLRNNHLGVLPVTTLKGNAMKKYDIRENITRRLQGLKNLSINGGVVNRMKNIKKVDSDHGALNRIRRIRSAENSRPGFSIVVITYNPKWEKLKRTLRSILIQDFTDYEIIVTDDGSENDLQDKIEKYFEYYGFTHYTLLPHTGNKGTVRNLISGVEAARGKYVKDIGPGDLLYSRDTLSKVYDYMSKGGYQIAAGLPIGYTETPKGKKAVRFNHPFDIEAYLNDDTDRVLNNLIMYQDMACGANLCFDRDFFLDYLYRIQSCVTYAEDLIQIMAAINHNQLQIMPFRMVWYEVDSGSSTKKDSPFKKLLAADVERFYDHLLKLHPDNPLLIKRKKLSRFYKIDNLYLRTLLRSFSNPGLYIYMIRHYIQSIKGSHNPRPKNR